jgi:hypothetical protein
MEIIKIASIVLMVSDLAAALMDLMAFVSWFSTVLGDMLSFWAICFADIPSLRL